MHDLAVRGHGIPSKTEHLIQSVPPLRAESRWWVSPLPPPGLVEFGVFLPGAAGPTGTASMDAAAILEAAGRSRALWPAPEAGPL